MAKLLILVRLGGNPNMASAMQEMHLALKRAFKQEPTPVMHGHELLFTAFSVKSDLAPEEAITAVREEPEGYFQFTETSNILAIVEYARAAASDLTTRTRLAI